MSGEDLGPHCQQRLIS